MARGLKKYASEVLWVVHLPRLLAVDHHQSVQKYVVFGMPGNHVRLHRFEFELDFH